MKFPVMTSRSSAARCVESMPWRRVGAAAVAGAIVCVTVPTALADGSAQPTSLASASRAAAEPGMTPAEAAKASGTTIIVNTAPGDVAARAASDQIRAVGARTVTAWPQIGVVVALAPDNARAQSMAAALRKRPGISSAGMSGLMKPESRRAATISAPPSKKKQTPGPIAARANAIQAHAVATGRGVTVAIADVGVLDEHEELAKNFDASRSGSCADGGIFRSGAGQWRPQASDPDVHGTHSAAVAAGADNGVGSVGMAPDATVVSIRVSDDDYNFYPEATICSVMTAARQAIPIVNHSYGVDYAGSLRQGLWDPKDPNQAADIDAIRKALAYSRAHGVLNVAATGNAGRDDSDKPHVPLPSSDVHLGPFPARLVDVLAQLPDVLGVGQIFPEGQVADSSVSGFGITDLVAVGEGELAALPNTYVDDSGTSFSAPAVAGAAAVLKQLNPALTPDQLENALYASAKKRNCANPGTLYSDQPCRSKGEVTNFFGHGELDLLAAVKLVKGDRPSSKPAPSQPATSQPATSQPATSKPTAPSSTPKPPTSQPVMSSASAPVPAPTEASTAAGPVHGPKVETDYVPAGGAR